MPAAKQYRKAKLSSQYTIQLVKKKKDFDELETYIDSEDKRLKEIGYKPKTIEQREHTPGLLPVVDFAEYSLKLNLAKGKWPEEYKKNPELLKEDLPNMPRMFALVLRDKKTGKIAGYAFHESMGYSSHQDMAYVPPELRRRGLGKTLIKGMIKTARDFKYPHLEFKAEYKKIRGMLEKEFGFRAPDPRFPTRMVKKFKPPSKKEKKKTET